MGGGGNGGRAANGTSGLTNTGSGGGGADGASAYAGGTGGSGIVILAYPSTYPAAATTTGSPTVTTANGYNVYKFTATGSITF